MPINKLSPNKLSDRTLKRIHLTKRNSKFPLKSKFY